MNVTRFAVILIAALYALGAKAVDVVNPLPYDLVYVRAPYFGADWQPGAPRNGNSAWPDTVAPLEPDAGAQLMLLRADGSRELLFPLAEHRALIDTAATKPLAVGSVSDPTISFDARWVVFAWYHDLSPEARNTQRGSNAGMSFFGADLYRLNLQTRVVLRLTQQEFTPNTGNGATFTGFDPANNQVNPFSNHPRVGVFNTGPSFAPGGRIVFTSTRNGFTPPRLLDEGQRVLQLHAMDHDGRNVTPIGHFNLAMALHPQVLMDGRLVFSSWELQGLRDERTFALWVVGPDGRGWNSLSGYSDRPFAHHFATQMPDGDIVVERYYNLNNNGFGSLVRYPLDPPGGPFLSDDPAPGTHIPHERRDPAQPDNVRRVLTPFTTHLDVPAPCPGFESLAGSNAGDCPNSERRGKFTHPQATPAVAGVGAAGEAELLAVYTVGGANHRSGNAGGVGAAGLPWYHGEIVMIPDGETIPIPAGCVTGPGPQCPPGRPAGLQRVLFEENYNLQWPRPVVTYQQLYARAEPAAWPELSDGAIAAEGLTPGEPFGLIGSSSLIWRDTRAARYLPGDTEREPFNPASWDYPYAWVTQGTDAGIYGDDDIYAVRILAQLPRADLSYPGNNPQLLVDGGERLRILGEVPIRGALSGKPGDPNTTLPDGRVVRDSSFLARIPADVSVTFQTIDRRGMALNVAQTWHQVRPGEARYDCGGCHAHSKQPIDFANTAADQSNYLLRDLARTTPLLDLDGQNQEVLIVRSEDSISVEWFRDVAPLLNTRCASCHGGNNPAGPGPGLVLAANAPLVEGWPAALHALRMNHTDPVTAEAYTRYGNNLYVQVSRYLRAFQSRQSLLLWAVWGARLDGRSNATRVGDLDFASHPTIPGLSNGERMLLARWIDTGAGVDLLNFSEPGQQAGQQAVNGFLHDDLRPTLVLTPSVTAVTSAGTLSALRVSAFDIESGLRNAPGQWSVSADRALGPVPVGGNLAATLTLPADGSMVIVPLPIAVNSGQIGVRVRVVDQAGHETVVVRHYQLGGVLFDSGFENAD
ncbi:MAG: hypothetical protein SGI99_02310 [Pseudomonadota bacterium]|nr:hypothetical protein [Pseudomonadota bacterium]